MKKSIFCLLLSFLFILFFVVSGNAFTKKELLENAQISITVLNDIKKQAGLLSKYLPEAGEKFEETADKSLISLIQNAAGTAPKDLSSFLSDLAKETAPAKISEDCQLRYRKNHEALQSHLETLNKWTEDKSSVNPEDYNNLKSNIKKCSAENKILVAVIVQTADSALPHLSKNRRLRDAAKEGDRAKLEQALKAGGDVRAKAVNGYTALHFAMEKGNRQIVETLISKGADVNALNSHHMYNVELLNLVTLKNGNKVVSLRLMTAMMKRQKEVQNDIRTGKISIEKGYGYTPLLNAAQSGLVEIAELLIEKGANIEAQETMSGLTALQIASLHGKKNTVMVLIKKGANINAASPRSLGLTSLMIALAKNNNDVAELLIGSNANVNAKMELGLTPLHYAVAGKSKQLTEMLIAKGAEINVKDSFGNTPLTIAKSMGDSALVDFLKGKGAQ